MSISFDSDICPVALNVAKLNNQILGVKQIRLQKYISSKMFLSIPDYPNHLKFRTDLKLIVLFSDTVINNIT